jgi:hypothetical protein
MRVRRRECLRFRPGDDTYRRIHAEAAPRAVDVGDPGRPDQQAAAAANVQDPFAAAAEQAT